MNKTILGIAVWMSAFAAFMTTARAVETITIHGDGAESE